MLPEELCPSKRFCIKICKHEVSIDGRKLRKRFFLIFFKLSTYFLEYFGSRLFKRVLLELESLLLLIARECEVDCMSNARCRHNIS
jgi:hypothetical protein